MSLLDGITDIGACVDHPEKSLMFPGPVMLDTNLVGICRLLIDKFNVTNQTDATLDLDGIFWRGHKDETVVDGMWIRFRKMPAVAPRLDTLICRLPGQIEQQLMKPELSGGGLVLVVGGAGCGKTTTASAFVTSRLREYGGMAYTVEEPPEHPLNGWHEKGYCAQTWVKNDGPEPWARALKGVLRSQPTGTPTILFVGEVREDEAARIALLASANGFLVVATTFASDVVTGVEAFAKRVGPSNVGMLASQLKLLVYQSLTSGMLTVNLLRTTLSVANNIKLQKYDFLLGELTSQKNEMREAQRSQQRMSEAA